MKLIIIGLLLGLLFFGCTAPEAQAPAEETQAPTSPEPHSPGDGETAPGAVPEGTPDNGAGGAEPSVVQGEGTILEVGESIPVTGDDESLISESELSAHTMKESCWVLYKGKVYDVTGYLEHHEGGSSTITPYCGATDNSFADAFEGKHGTSMVEVLISESVLVGNYEG
ncbi:MAG: cytochrome b5-like heme/steroid binding domain-containing protein [Candidatus Micrarchaeota archaeon]